MSYDNTDVTDVVAALDRSLGEVDMRVTADDIVTAGRMRRRRRRMVGAAAGIAAITGLALAVNYSGAGTTPEAGTVARTASGAATARTVHIQTVGFTVNSQSDGTVRVTWEKSRYFEDHAALQAALSEAGFPVVMRVGEFCAGPGDDTTLDASGIGPGVRQVMKGEAGSNGTANLVFTPSAMPAGKQLFIGYLNSAQLAVTHGAPGSVERLVSVGVPLTCTTTPPPAES